MDWFKGKIRKLKPESSIFNGKITLVSGSDYLMGKSMVSGSDFPLNQSIDW